MNKRFFTYCAWALGIILICIFILTICSRRAISKDPQVYYLKNLQGKLLGQTIPPIGIFIDDDFIYEGSELGSVLAHERAHWVQYQELGLGEFYWRYITGYLKYGRFKHPMEIEARKESL